MKRILNNKYEEIINLIFKKIYEDKKINIRKKKEIDLKINEVKEEYGKIIKKILIKNDEYKKINEDMKEKEEKYKK